MQSLVAGIHEFLERANQLAAWAFELVHAGLFAAPVVLSKGQVIERHTCDAWYP